MRLLLSLVPLILIASGCIGDVVKAENGDHVFVHYTGTLDDGTVFDSSREPLEFDIGAGQMIAGFDSAVVGMKAGQEKTVKIKAADAYGEINNDLIRDVPKAQAPNANPGDMLYAGGQPVKVVSVGNTTVKIDFNHPFAGKDLTFKITMVKIEKRGK